ncbi:cryptococcal xylosyltransferase 1 [Naganishia albida]|nr:cryptococcal xylosyltransferase 1 [Naganishia albida]
MPFNPRAALALGLPRRYIFLASFLASILILTIASSHPTTRQFVAERTPDAAKALHPANWGLPFAGSAGGAGSASGGGGGFLGGNKPQEFDEYGRCLFLSPFDALSAEEKQRAEQLVLTDVSDGIVRSRASVFIPAHHQGNTTDAKETLTNPILGLLRDGERKWQDMLARQSKTLDEAVQEYKTRWGRNPPRGFDEWWEFAKNRGVLLPDEYDSIMQTLLPFYAFTPAELEKRNGEAEKTVETFTMIVKKGKVEVQWNDEYSRDHWWASRPRADAQVNLMEPFLGMLSDFRATFTIHDQPSIMPSHERMSELVHLAKTKQITRLTNEKDVPEMNWLNACPKDSPAVKGEQEPDAHDTFVSSHLSAMNPCNHPSLLHKHGITIEQKNEKSQPKPHTRIMPIFVPSRTLLHADIPITPVGKDGRRDDVGDDPAWNAKSNKLYWRGLATGLQHNKHTGAQWRDSHRERLHFLANDASSSPRTVLEPVGASGRAVENAYPANALGQYYMDVKLSGGHWQCDGADGTCDEMNQEIEFGSKDSPERSNAFKYVFDTDGNAWSSRFPRLMASKNMVIKASIFPEWNTQTLPEWYAYVPSKMDYSDIYSILAFFRGTQKGKGGHDEVARRIASNGQCWVEKTWRREDLQAYMFRLYLEFARVMSPDRDNGKMDFVL